LCLVSNVARVSGYPFLIVPSVLCFVLFVSCTQCCLCLWIVTNDPPQSVDIERRGGFGYLTEDNATCLCMPKSEH